MQQRRLSLDQVAVIILNVRDASVGRHQRADLASMSLHLVVHTLRRFCQGMVSGVEAGADRAEFTHAKP